MTVNCVEKGRVPPAGAAAMLVSSVATAPAPMVNASLTCDAEPAPWTRLTRIRALAVAAAGTVHWR